MQWLWAIMCCLASGCSLATVGPASFAPPREEKIAEGIFRIAFPQGGVSDCGTIVECTLLTAADTARRARGSHFMVLPGHGGATQVGYAYIKVLTLDEGDGVPRGAISVDEAFYFFGKSRAHYASN